MCNAVIFISIFNIFPRIYMADLLQMLLSYIFIILGKICQGRIFWTIRQIDVSCICYCIFIICGNKSGACICLLSILPFVDMQNVRYARIICGDHIFYGKFYICGRICLHHILIKVFYICRRIVNTYAAILYSPRFAVFAAQLTLPNAAR